MTPYDLKALASGRKGRATLPPIEERIGSVITYRRVLLAFLRGMAKETRESVLPELRRERGLVTDAVREGWFDRLKAMRMRLTREATEAVERILRLESRRHTARFVEDARRTLGIDLKAVVREEDLTEALATALNRNAALITSLGDDVLNRVEQTIYASATNGTALREVRKQLQHQFGVTKSRADLIAQDQVAKLNSDLNRLRQTQAGVAKYVWRSSVDERVRPLHARLNGTEYRWGKPTGAENGLPPGQPVRCRCVAIGVVEF